VLDPVVTEKNLVETICSGEGSSQRQKEQRQWNSKLNRKLTGLKGKDLNTVELVKSVAAESVGVNVINGRHAVDCIGLGQVAGLSLGRGCG